MLGQRLVFGSLMILALCGLIALDAWLSQSAVEPLDPANVVPADGRQWLRALPVTLLVLVLVIWGTFELGALCCAGGYTPAVAWAAFINAGLVLLPWMDMQQRTNPSAVFRLPVQMPLHLFWITGGLLGTCLLILARRATERAVGSMAATLFLILYVGLLGSFVTRIRCIDASAAGAALCVFFILVVKAGDIGAYFIGKLFGRNKLAPWVSPGKTIEGAVGALLLAIGAANLGVLMWSRWGGSLGPAPLSYTQAVVFGALMAVVGHLGDLVESLIKRDVGAKDSASVIPAFGGLLDLVDSPLFAAPVAWFLLTSGGKVG